MRKIDLHSYSIYFNSVVEQLQNFLTETDYSSLFILVDEHTSKHCLPLLTDTLPDQTKYIQIESGEIHKNLQTCTQIWTALLEQGADRQSILINLGGGVIGDMGGFCAATFMRGIRFIQIPTTLLAMVDASVGSKLGVDFKNAKNMIGLFQDPMAVVIDHTFLNTLPIRELRSGFAEVIKHALVRDVVLWKKLLAVRSIESVDNWEDIIYSSVQIKKEVVEEDPREKSLRKILNFGHTIGHAMESHFLNTEDPLLHGEAVAWGMYAEAALSHQQKKIPIQVLKEIQEYIQMHFNHSYPQQLVLHDLLLDSLHDLILLMQKDKKNINQQISISLLERLGHCTPDHMFSPQDLEKRIGELFA